MRTRRTLAGLAALVFLAGSAQSIDLRPSTRAQIRLGAEAAQHIRREHKVLPDSDERVKAMRELAARLIATIPEDDRRRRPWEYTFDIIESEEVNAFALPGGPIFFYRGLVDMFETEDQFAAIIAHEIAHVRHAHWAAQYADNLRRRLGIGILLGLLGANRDIVEAVSVADVLAFTLPYSRKHETEADRTGYQMMVDAGFNPQGKVDVFRKLQAMKGGGRTLEIFSTHPDDGTRKRRLSEMIERSGRTFPPQRPLSYLRPAGREDEVHQEGPAGDWRS
jgi:predicted Zn-dependent protease